MYREVVQLLKLLLRRVALSYNIVEFAHVRDYEEGGALQAMLFLMFWIVSLWTDTPTFYFSFL